VQDRTAIGGGAEVTDIGPAELVGPQAGELTGQNQGQVSFRPVCAALQLPVAVTSLDGRK
jgi:hypothetical protein